MIAELILAVCLAHAQEPSFEKALEKGRLELLASHQERASGLLRLKIENLADFVQALDAESKNIWGEVFRFAATAKPTPEFRARLAAMGVRAGEHLSRVEGALRRAKAIAEVTPKDLAFLARAKRLKRASESLRARSLYLTADTGWDLARTGFKNEADALHQTARRAWQRATELDGKAAVIVSRLGP